MLTTSKNRLSTTILIVELVLWGSLPFALLWLISHGRRCSGALLVISVILVAALILQSDILRRRFREK